MLERKSIFGISKSKYKSFKNNGYGGIDGFIEVNSFNNSKAVINIHWEQKVRELKKGRPILWKGRLISPVKINVNSIKTQKITDLLDK